ncbi:hypothetical protein LJB87_01210 [Alistipes sp. OttesenSCG-928-L06]|nr:hypothetical protein [Alistipes sp. OttesenSCG-928-L06]
MDADVIEMAAVNDELGNLRIMDLNLSAIARAYKLIKLRIFSVEDSRAVQAEPDSDDMLFLAWFFDSEGPFTKERDIAALMVWEEATAHNDFFAMLDRKYFKLDDWDK